MRSRPLARRATAVAAILGVGLLLTGCAEPARPQAHVVVTITAKDRPHYDVRLADAAGAFRTASRMRPGETRSFAVPAGWVTVRVPGLCVVPTATTGTTTIDVEQDDCSVG